MYRLWKQVKTVMQASFTINLFCPMQCLWNAFVVAVYLYVSIGTFSSMTDGVPIVTYARSPEKRTVGFSVHHNGRSAVSVGARGSDNIVESSSDSRSGGREGTSGGGESGGGCQKSCKTKESHCTQYITLDLICGKIRITAESLSWSRLHEDASGQRKGCRESKTCERRSLTRTQTSGIVK